MRRWFMRRADAPRDVSEELTRAVVIAESHDETAASSTVLAAAGLIDPAERLLRLLVFLPAAQVPGVIERCASEDYVPAPALASDPLAPAGLVAVALARVQPIDARRVSQERSLLSSIAARVGGTVGGWAVLDVADPGR
ncbi:hypothetical protein [Gordonia sp. (in: high G+C Gram-positive bacteria)]|uniref:hypothetical protein n=1 Tax=Gordonia sp. (in: high G+C Gram-positive bacteria) TaxID=84139 RepID=UPI00262C6D6B|nr:hypothetical protein [Gordonia sp. (in: high G+C Gram-positive bacteria)]